jgi:hypothetical protein
MRWLMRVAMAAIVMLAAPAVAGAALVPHFTALSASASTQLSVPRDGLGMAPLPGGKALVVGGSNGGGFWNTAEIFDSATGTFTALTNQLGTARANPAVAPLPGGKVLIAGGATPAMPSVTRTAEIFDSATGTFTALPASGNTELSVARGASAAASLPDGRVLIVGGSDASSFLRTAELFDPASDTFTALPASGATQLATARAYPIAAPLPGGKVLIAGGTGGPVNSPVALASAEIFDPATETFSALPASGATELQTARTGAAAAPLPDGRVLIAGGDKTGSSQIVSADLLASAELFDPASNTFATLPAVGPTQLQIARAYMGATELGNGQVLIAGGAGPDYLASAELATFPPVCLASSATVASGAADGQVALRCSGVSFSYAIVSNPSHGSLGVINQSSGTLTYAPRPGFSGTDSFTYEATNVAGPSEAATVTLAVAAPPPSGSLGNVSVHGTSASVPITCQGAAGTSCTGTATFSTRVTSVGPVLVRVARAGDAKTKRKPKPKPKPKTTMVTVATARYAVPTGKRTTVAVTLNATGKRLLSRFYKLPTRMRVSGTVSAARTVQFHYAVIDASISYGFSYGSGVITVNALTPTTLPRHAKITLWCRGQGCLFSKRSITSTHAGSLKLAGQFHGARLHPGATIEVEVTAPLSVGQVTLYTMVRSSHPRISAGCLPPGARRPVACA